MMNSCDEKLAWNNGDCCCNCDHQLKLLKHPANKNENLKGACNKSTGYYACLAPEVIDNRNEAIVFDKKHGYCEMYYPRKKNE